MNIKNFYLTLIQLEILSKLISNQLDIEEMLKYQLIHLANKIDYYIMSFGGLLTREKLGYKIHRPNVFYRNTNEGEIPLLKCEYDLIKTLVDNQLETEEEDIKTLKEIDRILRFTSGSKLAATN